MAAMLFRAAGCWRAAVSRPGPVWLRGAAHRGLPLVSRLGFPQPLPAGRQRLRSSCGALPEVRWEGKGFGLAALCFSRSTNVTERGWVGIFGFSASLGTKFAAGWWSLTGVLRGKGRDCLLAKLCAESIAGYSTVCHTVSWAVLCQQCAQVAKKNQQHPSPYWKLHSWHNPVVQGGLGWTLGKNSSRKGL